MALFTVNTTQAPPSPPSPPIYVARGYNRRMEDCTDSYKPFNLSSAPEVGILYLGPVPFVPDYVDVGLLSNYSGLPYIALNIVDFQVIASGTNAPVPNAAKLYYNNVEVTNFPLVINITGVGPVEDIGLRLARQLIPVCGPDYTGFRCHTYFTITDNLGVTGPTVYGIYSKLN